MQSNPIGWFLYDASFNSITMCMIKALIMCALLQCMTEMTLTESLHDKVRIENTNHRSYSCS